MARCSSFSDEKFKSLRKIGLTGEQSHIDLLKNAVRQRISGMSVVEVDTAHQTNDLIKKLSNEIGERPLATIPFQVSDGASNFLAASRNAIRQLPTEEGVLFLTDAQDSDGDTAHQFWSEMNLLRESWAALDCHVVFMLLPGNYRMLIKAADHLADQIPLKLHLTQSEETSLSRITNGPVLSGNLSPRAARQQLSMSELGLAAALQKGTPKSQLIRRYYLPMIEAAIALNDLNLAQFLLKKVSEADILRADLPQWRTITFKLDYHLNNKHLQTDME